MIPYLLGAAALLWYLNRGVAATASAAKTNPVATGATSELPPAPVSAIALVGLPVPAPRILSPTPETPRVRSPAPETPHVLSPPPETLRVRSRAPETLRPHNNLLLRKDGPEVGFWAIDAGDETPTLQYPAVAFSPPPHGVFGELYAGARGVGSGGHGAYL